MRFVLFFGLISLLIAFVGSLAALYVRFVYKKQVFQSDVTIGLSNDQGNIKLHIESREWMDIRLSEKMTANMTLSSMSIRLSLGMIMNLLLHLEEESDFKYHDILKYKGRPGYELYGYFSEGLLRLHSVELGRAHSYSVTLNLDEEDQKAFFKFLLCGAHDMVSEA